MSKKIIKDNYIDLTPTEQYSVFQPDPLYLPLSVDDEQELIKVEAPADPAGTAPQPPQNVNVIFWDQSLYVAWEAGSAVDYYEVLVDQSGSTIVDIQTNDFTVKLEGAEFSIANDTSTDVTVSGVNAGDKTSAATDTGTPSDKEPQNLTQDDLRATEIDISWDAVTGAIYYKVFLKNTDSGETEQTISDIEGTSTTVFGLEDQTNYEIWVTSVSELEIFESDPSNSITFKADVVAPAAPTGLSVDSTSPNELDISWDANSETDLAGYNVYYRTGANPYGKHNSSLIAPASDPETYTLDSLTITTTYDIKVTAVDNNGNESDDSSVVQGTTDDQIARPTSPFLLYLAESETIYNDDEDLTTITDQAGSNDMTGISNPDMHWEETGVNGLASYHATSSAHNGIRGALDSFSDGALSQPVSFCVVFKVEGGSSGAMFFDQGGSTRGIRMGAFGSFELLLNAGSSISTGVNINDSTWHTCIGIVNGANSEVWLDNSLEASGDAGSRTHNGMVLFASGSGFQDMNGEIAELVIYERALSSADITNWFEYAKDTYGFTYTV